MGTNFYFVRLDGTTKKDSFIQREIERLFRQCITVLILIVSEMNLFQTAVDSSYIVIQSFLITLPTIHVVPTVHLNKRRL